METKQLEPAEIIRGEMGTWTHPVYSNYLGETLYGKEHIGRGEWEQLKNHFNIQTVTYWMEGHVNPDDWEKMMDASDISGWDPIAPIGFFLIDINFGEDDAYALFARNNIELKGKAFEAWHESKYGEHIIWSNGSPVSHIHNDRWQGWLAAQAPEANAFLSAALDAVQKLGSGDFILVPAIDIELAIEALDEAGEGESKYYAGCADGLRKALRSQEKNNGD